MAAGRTQKETSFAGKLFAEKDRVGNRYLVIDVLMFEEIMNSTGVQGASTVSGLVAAILTELAAINTKYTSSP